MPVVMASETIVRLSKTSLTIFVTLLANKIVIFHGYKPSIIALLLTNTFLEKSLLTLNVTAAAIERTAPTTLARSLTR